MRSSSPRKAPPRGTIKDGGLAVKSCSVDDLPALSASGAPRRPTARAHGKPLRLPARFVRPYSVEVSRDYRFAETSSLSWARP